MNKEGFSVVKSVSTASGEVFLVVTDRTEGQAEMLGRLCMAAVERTLFQFQLLPEPEWATAMSAPDASEDRD